MVNSRIKPNTVRETYVRLKQWRILGGDCVINPPSSFWLIFFFDTFKLSRKKIFRRTVILYDELKICPPFALVSFESAPGFKVFSKIINSGDETYGLLKPKSETAGTEST